MTYKALLTQVVADQRCDSRLRMAAGVGRALGLEVIGLGVRAPWPALELGRDPDLKRLLEATEEEIDAAKNRFEHVMQRSAGGWSWRSEIGYPDQVISRHARAADLILAYPFTAGSDVGVYAPPDTLVMESGLPVLLSPARETEFHVDRVLVAWKNTREARGAISAAVPMLAKASRVLIASVCGKGDVAKVEEEQTDVARRLARHGVAAAVLTEVGGSGSAGGKLLRMAEAEKSDLIVAGAYGHSRLREWIFGGVTYELLTEASRYVLLSR